MRAGRRGAAFDVTATRTHLEKCAARVEGTQTEGEIEADPSVAMLIFVRACLALAFFYSPPGSEVVPIDYVRIERAIEERNFAWAQQELEKVLTTNPRDFRAHLMLGIVYDEENLPQKAVDEFQKSTELLPRDPAPHVNLGKSYARRGDLSRAADEFRLALRLDPRNGTALENLGLALMGQGQYGPALVEFKKGLDRHPNYLSLLLNAFKAQLALKKFPEARASAERIIELASPSADLYNRLGAMQAEFGDTTGAIENLEKASALDPHLERTQYNLGLAYYRAGNLARALETLELPRQQHDTAEIENLMGEVYEKSQEYLKAVRAFQKAAEMEPTNEDYRLDFIHELLSHQNFDAAILVAQPAVHDFPQSQRLRLALGVAYFGRGQFSESLQCFLETAQKFPDVELPLYFLALAADATGKNLEETQPLLEAFLGRHPKQFWPYYFLGHFASRGALSSQLAGDFQHALDLLSKSIALEPNYPDSHLELGNTYFQLKRWQEASEEYQKALRLNPNLAEAHYRLAQCYFHTGKTDEGEKEMETHRKLKQGEAQETLRLRQVKVFLYKLRR